MIGSIVIHGALLVALVGMSIASALDGPQVFRGLNRYIIAAAPPEPPPPPPPGAPKRKGGGPQTGIAPRRGPRGRQPDIPRGTGNPVPDPIAAIGVGVPGGTGLPEALPSAPPPVPEIPHVGGNIRVPQRLVYVPPTYPPIALSARVEGTVILEATLDAAGAVRDVKVVKSVPLLDRAATEAVLQWRYSPTRLNGVPVPVIMTITVRFALNE